MRRARASFVLLTILSCTATAVGQDVSAEIVLVEGRQADKVEAKGRWVRTQTGFVAEGPGCELRSIDVLGKGDFIVRARIGVHGVAKSGAGVRLGASFFCFSRAKDGKLLVRGPAFHKGKSRASLAKHQVEVPNKKPFIVELRRGGAHLSVFVNEALAHRAQIGKAALGSVALVPGKAKMRVLRWSIRGRLVTKRAFNDRRVREIQPQIDKAIDKGVAYVLSRQLRDGSWGYRAKQYRGGTTGLSVYTLIKGGLPVTHPAVERGLAFLESVECPTTYAAACQLMALQAAGRQRYRAKMQSILDDLLRWEKGGNWGYPAQHQGHGWRENSQSRPDLSNTQYAVLGLRAAWMGGLEVPVAVWKRVANKALHYQERERKVEIRRFEGTSKTDRARARAAVAGFTYTPYRGRATGSMTTAGIAILAISEQAIAEKLGTKVRRNLQWSIQKGLGWLGANWSVERNPGHGGWLHYYLYGLERVGSLLGLEDISGHPWYLDGARFLLRTQKPDGSWPGNPAECKACFSVLFLKRATSTASTGANERSKKRGDYAAIDGKFDVQMRGSGEQEIGIWIVGFSKAIREQHQKHGVRVAEVRYYLGKRLLRKVPGDPKRAWDAETYAIKHEFDKVGKYKVRAEVSVVRADAAAGATSPLVTLKCPGFTVNLTHVLDEWMTEEAAAAGKNLLLDAAVSAESADVDRANAPHAAVDGLAGTRWLCKKGAKEPSLTLRLKRRVRGDTIVLRPPAAREAERAWFDRVLKVEVRVNKRDRFVVECRGDGLTPTVFSLPRVMAISRIDLRLIERKPGKRMKGRAGFSEVAVELRKS